MNALHLLKVGIPAFLCFVMSMAHIIADYGFFTTDVAHLRHFGCLLWNNLLINGLIYMLMIEKIQFYSARKDRTLSN